MEEDSDWALMCPAESPGLDECWGAAFETLYNSYVAQGKYRRLIKARELWFAILDAQMETGEASFQSFLPVPLFSLFWLYS